MIIHTQCFRAGIHTYSSTISCTLIFVYKLSLIHLLHIVQYCATQLGMATVASSLSPHDAIWVFSELSKARKNFTLENELHLLYQVEPGN